MFQKIKEFLFGKLPAEQTPAVHVEAVPYKVEAPAVTPTPVVAEPAPVVATPVEPAKCGCGRSPTGLCVGLHKLTAEEWATHADNPSKPVAKAAPAKPAAKPRAKPAAKKPAATKPAAITAAKKPRARKPAQK
jgi:hypothetical protein